MSVIKKILKIFTTVSVSIAIILAILLVGIRLFGIQVYTVISPSMEPNYPTGSLVYVVKSDPDKLQVNDVITFTLTGETTATHRIIEIIPDETNSSITRFRTKGDNNETADASLVEHYQVVGKVIFCIPVLGFVAMYIQTSPGLYFTIAAALFILILIFITDNIPEGKRKTSSDSIQENEENFVQ